VAIVPFQSFARSLRRGTVERHGGIDLSPGPKYVL